MGSSLSIDQQLTSPTFYQSPWPVYDLLRRKAPVYWCNPWAQWIVTRNEDVSYILKNPLIFSSVGWELKYLNQLPAIHRDKLQNLYHHYETKVISNSDAPEHTRLRKLIARSFSPKVIGALSDQIGALAEKFFDDLPKNEEFDWIKNFSHPFPAAVIALLFGAPSQDTNKFENWSRDIIRFIGTGSPKLELAIKLEQSLIEFREYLSVLITARRLKPQNDLLSTMIEKSEDEDALTQDELISTCITILFAGHETTSNLLGTALLELLRNPDQWTMLVDNPDLALSATEEVLRLNGPVQRIRRVALHDTNLASVTIKKGDAVMAFVGSANRDETLFPNPNLFDIKRDKSQNLAFGGGVHLCIGAALSRLESVIVLQKLVKCYPRTQLAMSFQEEYFENMTFRGVKSLKLILKA